MHATACCAGCTDLAEARSMSGGPVLSPEAHPLSLHVICSALAVTAVNDIDGIASNSTDKAASFS